MQSIYYHDKERFVTDICERWTSDQRTGKTYPAAEFQKDLRRLASENSDLLAIVSRDHAKTTSVSKILTLWLLLYETEPSILFVMTKGLAEAVVGDIRRELETNSLILAVWGRLTPDDNKNEKNKKWRQRELQLTNNTELKAISKGEPIRGRRPTKVIIDDPQENKDVKNQQMADQFNNWIWTSVYPTISEGGSMVVLGTVISSNCFVSQLKAEAKGRDFKVMEYPCLLGIKDEKDIKEDADGFPIFPKTAKPLWGARWSLRSLQKRYKKMKRLAFLQEYMNIPFVVNGRPVFDDLSKAEIVPVVKKFLEFNFFVDPEKIGDRSLFFGIDIANGKVGGDYSTISVRDSSFNKIAEYKGWCSQTELAKILNKFCLKFRENKKNIIPEVNIGLAFLNKASEFEYFSYIYRTEVVDKVTKATTAKLGFTTSIKTKPMIIDVLSELLSEGLQVSKDTLDELRVYYHDENGGMNAISPYHDDLVIADALSCYAVKQGVSYNDILFV